MKKKSNFLTKVMNTYHTYPPKYFEDQNAIRYVHENFKLWNTVHSTVL